MLNKLVLIVGNISFLNVFSSRAEKESLSFEFETVWLTYLTDATKVKYET